MKTITQNVWVVLAAATLFLGCSSDDGGSSKLSGVPTGEIVAVELRDESLTGFSDGEGAQKWWRHVISSIEYNSEDCGDSQEIENVGYFAFYPNGNYYQKSSIESTQQLVGSWEWKNDAKKQMYFSNQTGEGEVTLTYLNEINIVFGSSMSAEGCSVTSYEQFNNPLNL